MAGLKIGDTYLQALLACIELLRHKLQGVPHFIELRIQIFAEGFMVSRQSFEFIR